MNDRDYMRLALQKAVAICQGQVIERIGEQIAPLTHLVIRRRHPNHRVGQRRIGPPADETRISS